MKLKDKKIEILAPRIYSDQYGNRRTDLATVATVWAYFRQLSGNEIYRTANQNYSATVRVEETALFQIGYRDDLTTAHVIRYRGQTYNITRIDTFEGYKRDLVLYCKLESR